MLSNYKGEKSSKQYKLSPVMGQINITCLLISHTEDTRSVLWYSCLNIILYLIMEEPRINTNKGTFYKINVRGMKDDKKSRNCFRLRKFKET